VIGFAQKHTLLRPRDLTEAGLPKDYLYQLAKAGVLQQVGRGLYRWPDKAVSQHQS